MCVFCNCILFLHIVNLRATHDFVCVYINIYVLTIFGTSLTCLKQLQLYFHSSQVKVYYNSDNCNQYIYFNLSWNETGNKYTFLKYKL